MGLLFVSVPGAGRLDDTRHSTEKVSAITRSISEQAWSAAAANSLPFSAAVRRLIVNAMRNAGCRVYRLAIAMAL